MTVEEIIKAIAGLSESERAQVLGRISPSQASSSSESPRLRQLLDKQGRCPHCGGSRYYRFGRDKGAQRFRCHDCGRTFTEYTGTWQSGLHRRDLASRYMSLMSQNKSLDKISSELRINKKTAFDWRHKILGTFRQDRGESFEGIVESDETFLYESEKGGRNLKRPARKRGGSGQKGITDKLVAVIVTADRRHSLNITSCGAGRLTKEMVSGSLVTPLPASTTLCSDGHKLQGICVRHKDKARGAARRHQAEGQAGGLPYTAREFHACQAQEMDQGMLLRRLHKIPPELPQLVQSH